MARDGEQAVESGVELTMVLDEIERRRCEDRLSQYWPYRAQARFHAAGAKYRERLLRAPNRVGKTLSAAAEVAIQATGLYPAWWKGWRSDRPVQWGVASETSLLTRDGAQRLLFGFPAHPLGRGMIPKRLIIGDPVRSHGAPDSFESVHIRHVTGGESVIYLRSYDQGRERIQAMELDGFWLDEEPDEDYYLEALTRTNINRGPVFLTFTPLKGMSTVVKRFMKDKMPGTIDVHMDLEDADHFTEEDRRVIEAQYPEHEREARAHGVPVLGSGRVFPVPEELIRCKPIAIPPHWPRLCGVDFGIDHPTAAVWVAWDRDADVVYVTDCYRRRDPSGIANHVQAIRAKGQWIPVSWPHDGLQKDKGSGIQLAEQYRDAGVNMRHEYAHFEETEQEGEGRVNLISTEAGVSEMLTRMQTGRFKVFEHLNDWWEELRMYYREKGVLKKEDDDLLSASRICIMDLRYALVEPKKRERYRPAPNWRY